MQEPTEQGRREAATFTDHGQSQRAAGSLVMVRSGVGRPWTALWLERAFLW